MEGESVQDSKLEKYSRLLLKEIEVHEKMERASRLAVRYSGLNSGFITPERNRKLQRTYTDGPLRFAEHSRLVKSESLQAMSQTWDEGRMKRALQSFAEDNSSSSSTSSIPRDLEHCLSIEPEKKVNEKPKRRSPSAALIQRRKEAEAKNLLRTQRLQSLEKDCQRAHWMINRIKALSMPSLGSEPLQNKSDSVSKTSLDGLLLSYDNS